MGEYSFRDIYEGIEKSAAFYAEAMRSAASKRFDAAKASAKASAMELLVLSDDLRDIGGALEQNPGLLEVARLSCKPPLTRDKLGGMAGIRPYRLADFENSSWRSTPLQRRKMLSDMERLAPLLDTFLDREIAYWLEDDRNPSPAQRSAWASSVADRAACQADLWGKGSGLADDAVDAVRRWLDLRGYEEWPPCGGCEYGNGWEMRSCGMEVCPVGDYLEPGTFQCADGIGDPEFLVVSRLGELAAIDVFLSADPGTALKSAEKLAGRLLAANPLNSTPILVVGGLVSSPFLAKMESEGVAVVWLHDLDKLEQLGL